MSFTIKELEALSGIKAHTIRIWEQRYSFLKPSRTTTNIRTYSNEELKTILTVALLNKHGFKISRINNMEPAQRQQQVLSLKAPEALIEQQVNSLIACMIDLDAIGFEAVLNNYLKAHDVASLFQMLVFPFLERTGILWQTSRITRAHEHLASAVIRQKIISAIDGLPLPLAKTPLFLLLLPEDEHHELGLLLVYYLLKREGLPVLYLGANVPLKDALYVVQVKAPQAIYLHLTATASRAALQKFIAGLAGAGKADIVLSGAAIEANKKGWPAGVKLVFSFADLHQFIATVKQD